MSRGTQSPRPAMPVAYHWPLPRIGTTIPRRRAMRIARDRECRPAHPTRARTRSYLLHRRLSEEAMRPDRERHDDEQEREDVRVCGAEHRRDERLDDAEHEPVENDAARAAEPAEDRHRERLESKKRAHFGGRREE